MLNKSINIKKDIDASSCNFSYCFRNPYRSLARLSNNSRKNNTKVIIQTKYNRSKQCDEVIRIPSNYPSLAQRATEIARKRCDWFWLCFLMVENWREILKPISKRSNHNVVHAFDSHVTTLV